VIAPPLLRVRDLSVRRGDNLVVRDVNLRLHAGEALAILGPNGAGKSTLLEAIAGVVTPTAGTVETHGRVATALQSPDLASRTARANVELALAWWGVARAERRTRADAALSVMHAEHLADRLQSSMSGGERRRVHLARALAVNPDVLMLDEPFAGLDVATRGAILDDAGAAIRHGANAAILVVHDRAEAWALADRVVVLLDGAVAAEGTPRDVLDHPPTPAVARFVGFGGEVRDRDGVLMARPSQVRLDPYGDVATTVTRLIPIEDGVRVILEAPDVRLSTITPLPGPSVGDQVRVSVVGGVRFWADGG
jgi:ABC-type sulfate/molybdate transport systems ATPase subunit